MLRLKKDKKTKKIRRGKIIRPIILKALMVLLLLSLNWAGLSAVGRTLAYYNDTENSGDNSYQADSLDFSLSSASDFSPKVTPVYSSTRLISIQNEGNLDFSYSVKVDNFSGDLCDYLNIKDDLSNSFQSLENFVSVTTTFSAKNSWLFTIKLTSNNKNLQNKTCVFDLVFSGWQTNFPDSSHGFTDIERITNTVVSADDWTPPEISNIVYLIGSPGESNDLKAIITWDTNENSDSFVDYGLDSNYGNTVGQNDSVVSHSVEISGLSENTTYHFRVRSKDAYGNELVSGDYTFETKGSRLGFPPYSNVVINEFLPNPIGNDNALMPDGEWVELYNRGSSPVNLSGWFLTDSKIFHKLPVPDSVINPGEFLVVYLNGAYSPGWLNNNTDIVSLWAPTPFGIGAYLVDSHFYSKYPPFNDTVLENKSFARIPDGSNKWYDPIPTPGAPNRLSDEEEIELGLINNQDTDNGTEDPSETVNENEDTGGTGDAESTGNAESIGDTENEEETDTEQLSNDGVNQDEATFEQDSVMSGQDSPGGEASSSDGKGSSIENDDVDNGDNEGNNSSEVSDTEKVEPEEQGSLDDDSGQGDDNDSQSTNQNENQNNNQDDNQNDEEN